MAKININLEVSLEELRAMYWLISNMFHIINLAKKDEDNINYPFYGFLDSQERNLSNLENLYKKIEPIVEK